MEGNFKAQYKMTNELSLRGPLLKAVFLKHPVIARAFARSNLIAVGFNRRKGVLRQAQEPSFDRLRNHRSWGIETRLCANRRDCFVPHMSASTLNEATILTQPHPFGRRHLGLFFAFRSAVHLRRNQTGDIRNNAFQLGKIIPASHHA